MESRMLITVRGTEPAQARGLATFFASAFRPFFLFAALEAVLGLGVWVSSYLGGPTLTTRWPPSWWHAHEMVFGFALAAIAGFMLTAAPKWTNSPAPKGLPVAALAAAWVLARAAAWGSSWLPDVALVIADQLVLVPLLIWSIVRIVGARSRRNYAIPVLLMTLSGADLAFHLQLLGVVTATRPLGVYLAIDVAVVLVALISGRIVPAFTASALKQAGAGVEVVARPRVGIFAVVAAGVCLALDLLIEPRLPSSVVAFVAAAALTARAWGWRPLAARRLPIVWILHVGHAWLIVGFVLLGVEGLTGLGSPGATIHAFTAGAIGTMILAVMTRASLGHSGRPLETSGWTVLGYVLISVGALVRVIASLLSPAPSPAWIGISGSLWIAAFVVFAIAYWPVLTQPRVDGRPG
jgi:uncharacterized protein involved in response to NO